MFHIQITWNLHDNTYSHENVHIIFTLTVLFMWKFYIWISHTVILPAYMKCYIYMINIWSNLFHQKAINLIAIKLNVRYRCPFLTLLMVTLHDHTGSNWIRRSQRQCHFSVPVGKKAWKQAQKVWWHSFRISSFRGRNSSLLPGSDRNILTLEAALTSSARIVFSRSWVFPIHSANFRVSVTAFWLDARKWETGK